MQLPFRILDVSGDIGLSISGSDLKELFSNAALGLYHLITTSKLKTEETVKVALSGMDVENLLINWLNELIFLFDTRGFIANFVDIKYVTETELKAEIKGGFFDEKRCERGLLVKAATYHGLEIKRVDGVYFAKIIFDI